MLEGLEGLDNIIAELDGALEEALDAAAEHALAVAKSHTKGELAASLTIKRGKGTREILTDKDYAGFVENGRGAISARGKALHFVVNGRDIFVRHVGPAKPHPFMEPAQADLESRAADIMEKVLGKIA